MNKKEILRKVGGILTELNEQFEYLSKSPDNLNELELELFSANANFLSDHLSILVKLNETNVKTRNIDDDDSPEDARQPEPEKVEELPAEREDDMASDWKFDSEKETGLNFDFGEKQTDMLYDQPLTEEERRVIDEDTQLKPENEADHKDYKNPEGSGDEDDKDHPNEIRSEINNEVYVKEVVISERTIAVPAGPKAEENPAPTVNDLLSMSVAQQTVGSQLTAQQPKDLKGMISLNDKLLFVRDLFNGYSLAYSEALELLNRFDSLESAENFLKQNYAVKNNWADKHDVAEKFYEILNRRFSK